GHGAGMPLSKQIDLTTDVYAFTLHNMGIESI
ncbi:prolyl endopeptidase domain protein, partial [Vibrio parahaemolyticus V-223/04]